MRSKKSFTTLAGWAIVSVLCATNWCAAQDDIEAQDFDADALLDAASAFAIAYNKGDAEAIGKLFAPDGEMIDNSGNVFRGRDRVQAEFAAYFQLNPGAEMEIDVEQLRPIAPGVVVEDGTSTLTSSDGSIFTTRYTIVHLKQGDQWLMGNVRVLDERPLAPHDRLKALEWLVGEWIDESQDSHVATSIKWSEDGNFILADFQVNVAGVGVVRGRQRIGWDPRSEQFKSWVFDSEGGHGEGLWSQVGDEWVVKVQGVRPDGTAVSMTNVYTPLNADSYGFRSVDRIAGNEAMPNVVATVVRRPPTPQVSGIEKE
jgi:uncharacterized protein (TIGR02246 family)